MSDGPPTPVLSENRSSLLPALEPKSLCFFLSLQRLSGCLTERLVRVTMFQSPHQATPQPPPQLQLRVP